jgi:hypothetical protein
LNEIPPNRDPSDDVDELYRRAAALDRSRPSEPVRRAVLAHAARVAEENKAGNATAKRGTPRRNAQSPWWRPAIFGTLAAAAIAGLLVTPQFLPPRAPETAALSKSKDAKALEARRDDIQRNADAYRTPAESELSESAQLRVEAQPAAPPAPFPEQAPARVAAAAPARVPAVPPAPMFAQRQSMPKAQASAANSAAVADSAADKLSSNAPGPGVVAGGAATGGASASGAAAGAAAAGAFSAGRVTDPAVRLRRAAEAGDLSQLQSVIEQHADIESRDAGGRTALMLATLQGQAQSVDALLAAGADPNAADARGVTPLQAAIAGGKTGIAAALRRAGAR